MTNKKKYLLGLLLGLSFSAKAQDIVPFVLTNEERQNKIIEIQEKYRLAKIKRADLLKEAKKLGISEKVLDKNGKVKLLIDIQNGVPIYIESLNETAAVTISTDDVYPGGTAGLSLTGNGEVLGMWEAGGQTYTDHENLTGRVTQEDAPPTYSGSFEDHATHVAGTMVGSGEFVPHARGMAYQASLKAFNSLYDVYEMEAQAANGLRVSNHSYTISAWSMDDPLYGHYSNHAEAWDNITNNYPNYLIVAAAGNFGFRTSTGYDCLPGYGNAKNVLTVGAIKRLSFGWSWPHLVYLWEQSSTGPTDDGRIKPDLVAQGENIYSSTYSTLYNFNSGTSMAAPTVSGSIGLLNQHQKNLYGSYVFRASTIKALLIHTADEAGENPGPDYKFGWGVMNTRKAADVMSRDAQKCIYIKEKILNNGQQISFKVKKILGENLKVTICWNDPATFSFGIPDNQPDPKLINDLDVKVMEGSTTYRPYVLGGRSNPSAAASTGDNIVDNVEQVFINNTNSREYEIIISHKGTLSGNSQVVSIIVTGHSEIVEHLLLTTPLVTNTQNYDIKSTIIAKTDFGVGSTGNVSLIAREVNLETGFEVETGGIFTASWQDMSNCGDNLIFRSGLNNDYIDDNFLKTVDASDNIAPSSFVYPNPINASSILSYTLNEESDIEISVLNIVGKEFLKEELGTLNPGEHSYLINTDLFPKGIYVYNIKTRNKILTGKFLKE